MPRKGEPLNKGARRTGSARPHAEGTRPATTCPIFREERAPPHAVPGPRPRDFPWISRCTGWRPATRHGAARQSVPPTFDPTPIGRLVDLERARPPADLAPGDGMPPLPWEPSLAPVHPLLRLENGVSSPSVPSSALRTECRARRSPPPPCERSVAPVDPLLRLSNGASRPSIPSSAFRTERRARRSPPPPFKRSVAPVDPLLRLANGASRPSIPSSAFRTERRARRSPPPPCKRSVVPVDPLLRLANGASRPSIPSSALRTERRARRSPPPPFERSVAPVDPLLRLANGASRPSIPSSAFRTERRARQSPPPPFETERRARQSPPPPCKRSVAPVNPLLRLANGASRPSIPSSALRTESRPRAPLLRHANPSPSSSYIAIPPLPRSSDTQPMA